MIKIIDASVAIKWFVEEKGKEKSLKILDQVKTKPSHFGVPELFFNEMLFVLCKLIVDTERVTGFINILQDLGFERFGNGRKLLDQAVLFCRNYGLGGYDAIYAANAKLTGGLWLTADEKAHKKIASLGISQLL